MQEVVLDNFGDNFVIHYGGQLSSVEANTFANSLVNLSNIIQEINSFIHPECKVEIRVEALGLKYV